MTNATRRAILAGVPAAAIAASVPGTLKADPADSAAWERVKADFIAAAKRFDAAVDADSQADGERVDFQRTAPTREVTTTEDGWTVATDDMHIDAKPRTSRMVLTDRNFDDEAVRKTLAGTAGYAALAVELATWRKRRDALALELGWDAAFDEWSNAADAHFAAWEALIACPLADAAQIAEKVELARPLAFDEDKIERLLGAIAADLRRLTAN